MPLNQNESIVRILNAADSTFMVEMTAVLLNAREGVNEIATAPPAMTMTSPSTAGAPSAPPMDEFTWAPSTQIFAGDTQIASAPREQSFSTQDLVALTESFMKKTRAMIPVDFAMQTLTAVGDVSAGFFESDEKWLKRLQEKQKEIELALRMLRRYADKMRRHVMDLIAITTSKLPEPQNKRLATEMVLHLQNFLNKLKDLDGELNAKRNQVDNVLARQTSQLLIRHPYHSSQDSYWLWHAFFDTSDTHCCGYHHGCSSYTNSRSFVTLMCDIAPPAVGLGERSISSLNSMTMRGSSALAETGFTTVFNAASSANRSTAHGANGLAEGLGTFVVRGTQSVFTAARDLRTAAVDRVVAAARALPRPEFGVMAQRMGDVVSRHAVDAMSTAGRAGDAVASTLRVGVDGAAAAAQAVGACCKEGSATCDCSSCQNLGQEGAKVLMGVGGAIAYGVTQCVTSGSGGSEEPAHHAARAVFEGGAATASQSTLLTGKLGLMIKGIIAGVVAGILTPALVVKLLSDVKKIIKGWNAPEGSFDAKQRDRAEFNLGSKLSMGMAGGIAGLFLPFGGPLTAITFALSATYIMQRVLHVVDHRRAVAATGSVDAGSTELAYEPSSKMILEYLTKEQQTPTSGQVEAALEAALEKIHVARAAQRGVKSNTAGLAYLSSLFCGISSGEHQDAKEATQAAIREFENVARLSMTQTA